MRCDACGALLPEQSNYCPKCGAPCRRRSNRNDGCGCEADGRILLPLRGGRQCVYDLDELYCFERQQRTTVIYGCGAAEQTRLTLGELERLLPESCFARPHNSFLVGLRHVRRLERTSLCLADGRHVPLSRQRRKAFSFALSLWAAAAPKNKPSPAHGGGDDGANLPRV